MIFVGRVGQSPGSLQAAGDCSTTGPFLINALALRDKFCGAIHSVLLDFVHPTHDASVVAALVQASRAPVNFSQSSFIFSFWSIRDGQQDSGDFSNILTLH